MEDLAISLKNTSFSYQRSIFKKKLKPILNNVSLNIVKGKCYGLVGNNGAGKSTVLKLIAGILEADNGAINLYGNKAHLLSLGVGFFKHLSGRENARLYFTLMGQHRLTTDMNEAVDFVKNFSELGDNFDEPVGTYSSGMYSRLAFSLAIRVQYDILLIDEVLSVGDAGFQEKSYGALKEIIKKEHITVIIVSHSQFCIDELCDEVLVMKNGGILQSELISNVA